MSQEAIHNQIRSIAVAAGHGDVAAIPDDDACLTCLITHVPAALWGRISTTVRERFHKLEARYGRATATGIVVSGIVGTAVPLPGTSLIAMAPIIGLAELHHQLAPTVGTAATALATNTHLAANEMQKLGKEWVSELIGLLDRGEAQCELS